MANNSYKGWEEADLPLPGRWLDFETYTTQSLVTFMGPPPYAYPPPNRTAIDLGGEQIARRRVPRPYRSRTGSNSRRTPARHAVLVTASPAAPT